MTTLERTLSLYLDDGSPRWIRCYDDGGQSIDRYTVVFTRLGHKRGCRGLTVYLAMSGAPFHPQGFCQHGEHEGPIDRPAYSHLGRKIRFYDLPDDCQRAVVKDYADMWEVCLCCTRHGKAVHGVDCPKHPHRLHCSICCPGHVPGVGEVYHRLIEKEMEADGHGRGDGDNHSRV